MLPIFSIFQEVRISVILFGIIMSLHFCPTYIYFNVKKNTTLKNYGFSSKPIDKFL